MSRLPASVVALMSATGCEMAMGRSRGSQATSSCSLSDLLAGLPQVALGLHFQDFHAGKGRA